MARETNIPYKIALLATGDEICRGDIMNTNSQEIAHRLVSAGMEVRLHMSAPDTIIEIEQAIRFLLSSHQALIITGGLGPTSDDLTRYALSKVLDKPLEFDEDTWHNLCERLKKFGYPTPPESNRQQALFPQGSHIIPNPNGTASGCMAEHEGKQIFMLPGPPNECLPIVDQVVLPALRDSHFSRLKYHQNWYLFGVSEGKIAEELDLIAQPFDCVTGYRLFYPYLEFKLHSNNEADFLEALPLMEKAIQTYLIGDGKYIASDLLKEKLSATDKVLTICDHATGGALEAMIKTPLTHKNLHFVGDSSDLPRIEINGLSDYWQSLPDTALTDLEIQFFDQKHHEEILMEIPFRGKRVVHYAVEYICRQIYELLALAES